jgi:hypothetical protein
MSSNSRHITMALALTACVVLAGCSDIYYDRRDSISLSAGEPEAANRVTQMVDPWPRASANRNIAFNGQKMQTAVERYRTNQVTPPVSATTSSATYQQQMQQPTAQTPGTKQ